MPTSAKKLAYKAKLYDMLDTHKHIFMVGVDNVGSKQMQEIRISLRGKAIVLMGKNTTIRKVFSDYLNDNMNHPCSALLPYIKGNVGFVFTNGDLGEVRETLEANRVPAPARVGSIAPVDVIVPPGMTECDPGQTAFFQTLQIATKINKGKIEITSEVNLLTAGDKVGNSEAALLQKLGIRPFTYGLILQAIYDNGSVFSPAVLDITDDDLTAAFTGACRNIAGLSMTLGIPTPVSLPYSIHNAFKTLVSIAVECEDYSFPKADEYKEFLKDPSKFIVASSGPSSGGGGETAAEEKKEEEEEEEEVDIAGGMDMFGDGGGDDY